MSKLIFLSDLDLRNSPMVRAEVDADTVAEYAITYKPGSKVKLPPVEVFTTGKDYYILADGLHRVTAVQSLKQKTIIANVTEGGYDDALRFALTANNRHGLRRSRADKQRSIIEAVKAWPTLSDRQIADVCAVDNHTVANLRKSMEAEGEVQPEPVRKAADGKKRAAAQPAPAPVLLGNSPVESTEVPATQGSSKKKVVDSVGVVIPNFALQFWLRTPEVKELIGHLSHVGKELRRIQAAEDIMFAEINFSGALSDLDRVWTNVLSAVPYAVCTTCAGHPDTQPKGECRLCRGRGLISKFRWDSLVPSEVKAMLLKKGK